MYKTDTFEEIHMDLQHNKIIAMESDNDKIYRVSLDNMISLRKYLQTGVSYSEFYKIVEQICLVYRLFNDAYIKKDTAIYFFEQFIIDLHTNEVKCCYFKSISAQSHLCLKQVINELIAGTSFLMGEAIDSVLALVDSESLEAVNDWLNENNSHQRMIEQEQQSVMEDFREDLYETQLLQVTELLVKKRYCLRHQASGETIILQQGETKIGKYHQHLFIENDTISQNHALITVKENQVFIMDTQSRNKTWKNNKELKAFEKVGLTDGDCIIFSNEIFALEEIV